jgi:hypothetical protein
MCYQNSVQRSRTNFWTADDSRGVRRGGGGSFLVLGQFASAAVGGGWVIRAPFPFKVPIEETESKTPPKSTTHTTIAHRRYKTTGKSHPGTHKSEWPISPVKKAPKEKKTIFATGQGTHTTTSGTSHMQPMSPTVRLQIPGSRVSDHCAIPKGKLGPKYDALTPRVWLPNRGQSTVTPLSRRRRRRVSAMRCKAVSGRAEHA